MARTSDVHRYPPWRARLALLGLVCCIGLIALYSGVFFTDLDRGDLLLLTLCAPFAYLSLLAGARACGQALRRWGSSYQVFDHGLRATGPIGERTLAWSDVEDLELLPGAFPGPPSRIVLHDRSGAPPVEIDRTLEDFGVLWDRVANHLPALTADGPDAVRCRPETQARLRAEARTSERRMLLVILPVCALFLIGSVFMSVTAVRDYAHYRALARDGVEVEGVVEGAGRRGDSMWATVRFRTEAGEAHTTKRRVAHRLRTERPAGATVTVTHAPGDPHVNRIKDYDLDQRALLGLVLYVPMIGFLLLGVAGIGRSAFGAPVHSLSVAWRAEAGGLHEILVSDCPLERSFDLLEGLEGRPLVLWGLSLQHERQAGGVDLGAEARVELLAKAGIEAESIGDTFVLLAADQAAALRRRLSPTGETHGSWVAVPAGEAHRARSWLLERLDDGAPAAGENPYCVDGCLGPVRREQVGPLLDRVIKSALAGALVDPPAGLLEGDLAALLELDRRSETAHSLAIRRRGEVVEVWAREGEANLALKAEFRDRAWSVRREPTPGFLRERNLLVSVGLLLTLPLTLPIGLVCAAVLLPFERLQDRRRRTRLEQERAAVGGLR